MTAWADDDYLRADLINRLLSFTGTPRSRFNLAVRNYETLTTAALSTRASEFEAMNKQLAQWREARATRKKPAYS